MPLNTDSNRVHVSQLRVGMFVRLLEKWFDHPFTFSSLKIKNKEQITELQQAGIKFVLFVPEKSEIGPLPPPKKAPVVEVKEAEPEPEVDEATKQLWEQKKARIERLAKQKEKIQQCEKQYDRATDTVKNLMQNLFARPEQSIKQADELINDLVDSFMMDKDIVVHLMNNKSADENSYYHSLNVAVLSMMLAKQSGMDAQAMRPLGLGALLHDLGKNQIPDKVLRKREPLTPPEMHLFELHPEYGADLAATTKTLPQEAIDVILQHHEKNNGMGYPRKLKSHQISKLAKVVSIVNTYDNYCNCSNPEDSLTPAEALALMFKQQRDEFDSEMLQLFVRCMGVYPPGTVVRLSNDVLGMVISVNPKNLLHPNILVFDPDIPKDEALIFDMSEEPGLSIAESIRPGKLPKEVFKYLNPRTRISYFFDDSESAK